MIQPTTSADPSTQTTSEQPKPCLREELHHDCIACGLANPHGLHLRCTLQPDGSAQGIFKPNPHLKGFPNQLHGGIVTMLLDSAMAQCLLLNNIQAVTGTLDVRFRHPAPLDAEYHVTAHCYERRRTIHRMKAKIVVDGTVIATAQSQFAEVASF